MIDQIQKKQYAGNGSVSPIAAAVVGAVVGAGVAVAGAIALKDEKNRDKVKEVLANVKDTATGYVKDVKKQVESTKSDADDVVHETKDTLKKRIAEAKKAVQSI